MSETESQAILQARARQLARRLEPEARVPGVPCLTFALGAEVWAIELNAVLEVCRDVRLALLPGAQPPLTALTSWRGEVLQVVDVGALLGQSIRRAAQRLIIVGTRGAALGLVADDVMGVSPIDTDALQPARNERAQAFVRGVAESIVVLDHSALVQLYC